MKTPYPHLLPLFMIVFGLQPILVHGAELKFIPQVSLIEKYNDNIFFDSSDDDRVHDFVTVVSPALRLTDRTERLDASIQSRLERIEYLDEKDLNSTDQYHTGQIAYRLTERMNVSAEAGYIRDSQVDRDIESTGLVFGTPTRRRHHYACSADAALSDMTSMGVSYKFNEDKFDDPEYVNSTTQDVSLVLSRNLDALWSETMGRVSMGYAQYDYPETEVSSCSFMVGASKKITETLEISADIGSNLARSRYELFHFFDESSKTRGGIGQVALSYRGELSEAGISYYRDVRSISGKSGVARHSSARVHCSRRLTYELTGEFMAEYYLNKQDTKQFWETAIDEETFRITPRLLYNLTKDLRLEASYRYTRLKDNETSQTKKQDLFSLGMTWRYPLPR